MRSTLQHIQIASYLERGIKDTIHGTLQANRDLDDPDRLQTKMEADLSMFAFGAQLHALTFLSRLDQIAILNGEMKKDLRLSYSTNTLLKSSFNNFDENKDDYYKDLKGNVIYDESINSKQDFIDKGLSGTYLGKKHTEGDTYFGLFGEISNISKLVGKLSQKIDQTKINYANYYNGKGYERSVDFNLGEKFKTGILSSASDNLREFNYNGAKGYYHIFGSKDAMHGLLDRGSGNYSKNSNYGFFSLRDGWNVSIYNTKSARNNPHKPFNIINLVFPTQKSYDNFDKGIDYEFFGKKNRTPLKKIVVKKILD